MPLPLGEVPSAHTGRRGSFSLGTAGHVAALSVGFAASSPRGRAKWGAFVSEGFAVPHPSRPSTTLYRTGRPPKVWVHHQGNRPAIDSGGTPPLSDENQRFSPALPGGEPSGVHSFRKVSPFLIHLVRPPPCIEPGDPQWRGSTTRVAVS